MFRSLARFFYIWHTLVKYGIDQLIPKTPLHFIVVILTHLMPVAWRRELDDPIEKRARKAFEELGPIYVKFGQAVSTRPDLLSLEMAKELANLQDNVAPFSTEQAIDIIETSLKRPLSEAFAEFGKEILASASIAQVYTAKLHSGEDVVVKVVRPNIEKTIRSDMLLMRIFAQFFHLVVRELKPLRLPEVVAEFEKTIISELDLMQEASNATMLRHNFKDSEILYVPEIHWDYCAKNMLVMERVFATSIGDIDYLREKKVNLKELAARGVTIFFTQVFYHQYFHADMHPGNVFVDISNPEKPKYIAIDFGIMGSLNNQDQYYLAENFLAFFNRDYRRVAQLHIDSGWIPSTVKVTEFEAAIRKASEPIFGKPLKEISFAQFLLTLFQTARTYEMEVQPQLVLLQKTFFNVEGLGRVLYPELDLWDTGKPILEKWLKDSMGPKGMIKKLKNHAGEYTDLLTTLPLVMQKNIKEEPKQRQKQNAGLTDTLLLGFALLLLFQTNLWGGDTARLIIAGLAAILALRVLKRKNSG